MACDTQSASPEKALNLLLVDDEKGVVNALKMLGSENAKGAGCSATSMSSARRSSALSGARRFFSMILSGSKCLASSFG